MPNTRILKSLNVQQELLTVLSRRLQSSIYKLDLQKGCAMNKINIFTDGACSGNPGDGGWAAILVCGNNKKEISGFEPNTTNNRMELMAVIKAIECIKIPSEIKIFSDSAYVVNAFNQKWIENWITSGWKTSGRKPVQNKELWIQLLSLIKKQTRVEFVKVKGHSDNELNNRCDKLATSEYLKRSNLNGSKV